MKTISPALKTHIQSEVTTVCTCILVKRRDNAVFGFTDHDVEVDYAGTRYLPYYSFSRTSIQTTSSLEVDGLDMHGILNSSVLDRDSIAAGLFNFAEVTVYLVNYADTTMGAMQLRRGWFGEVVLNEDNTFTAEVRALSQALAYRIGVAYAPECDADLGDIRCKIPLDPPVWQPSNTYRAGDFVFGIIDSASGYINASLSNPSFETDTAGLYRTLSGWITYGDIDSRFTLGTSLSGLVSPAGGQFIYFTDNLLTTDAALVGLYQDWDMIGAGAVEADIDTGLCRAVFNYFAATVHDDGRVRGRLNAIDANGVVTNIFDSGERNYSPLRWFREGSSSILVPPGTRKLRVDLFFRKLASDTYDGLADGVQLALNDPTGNYHNADQYGGVVFKALNDGVSDTTQPIFTNLIGSDFTDNTITWECAASFKFVDVVASSITGNKIFTPTSLPGAAGDYNGGFLTWETGANTGQTYDVKTWNGTTIELFLRTFKPIATGDRYVIHPGCDKRLGTCTTRFSNVVNFRGQPHVPGQDAYMQTPNNPTS